MRNIVPNFVLLLQSNVPNMRATICQGLAKLLLASHINSPLVLANLILIWFSPITEKEPLVRQPLGVFFSIFSRKRPGASEIIVNAVVPALKGLDEMSEDEMYFDINPGSVAKLLVSLIRHDIAETPTERFRTCSTHVKDDVPILNDPIV
uniref:Cnd3 domain-containing protein n=1 Tax=Rhodnius prolixus TaxID=13249 RepID=T1IBX6_RHOPR